MPYKDPALAKAARRNRDHIRLASASDITAAQELAMRLAARKCPLCGIRLTDKPGLPNSKHLDHILPLGVGGTHTLGNVRITCQSCNVRRPRDGSDYTGQLTLWAHGPAVIGRPDGRVNKGTCRKGLHPWAAENIKIVSGKKRCASCDRERGRQRERQRLASRKECQCGALFAAPGSTLMCPECTASAARKAAELHAAGGMTWNQVAAEVGYGSGEGARFAAKRIGYVPRRPAPAVKPPKSGHHCQCGGLPYRDGRCRDCIAAAAGRAVALRGSGWTLQMIADELGYSSKSSVTNLLKAVMDIKPRMGRPANVAIRSWLPTSSEGA